MQGDGQGRNLNLGKWKSLSIYLSMDYWHFWLVVQMGSWQRPSVEVEIHFPLAADSFHFTLRAMSPETMGHLSPMGNYLLLCR